MTNVSGLLIEDYQDIESVNFAEDRKKEGWEEEKIRTYLARNSRDHARTPMQWNAEKHAGFIVNTGHATCQDVLTLVELCRDVVRERFGYELELEQCVCPDKVDQCQP